MFEIKFSYSSLNCENLCCKHFTFHKKADFPTLALCAHGVPKLTSGYATASDDEEVDLYGFSDEEEIGCSDECPDDNAQPTHKKKKKNRMNTLMAGI